MDSSKMMADSSKMAAPAATPAPTGSKKPN
jgi:hypothetical protein